MRAMLSTSLRPGLRPTPRPAGSLLALLAGAVLLSGCSDVRRTFGLERTAPDEFAVVSRAPLAMPPDFNLRPPTPGAPRPQEVQPREQAAATVFRQEPVPSGRVAAAVGNVSAGEAQLLARLGVEAADPSIRATVDREAAEIAAADQNFLDRLMFWREPEQPGTVVDPAKEAQRLRTNEALGKPVTEGETPIIVRRQRAPLEGLFD